MPMAICKFHIRSPCKWSHKQIILATLLGGLVAVTLTAGISISLAPARISFSVTNTIAGKSEDTQFYNFTLVAHNSSPRMAVLYGTLDAEIWYSPTVWVPALVDRTTALPDGRTPPDSETQMNVCAEYWQSKQVVPTTTNNNNNQQQQQPLPVGQAPAISPPATRSTANNTDWSSCTVMVIAKVWFKAGSGISTRSYDVRASCSQ
ncbi:hypothetical protein BRADI_4g01877v3, partial [Brachypodium distachyon]